jgi:hypothetical protein
MSTGAKKSAQCREDQAGGGNVVGKAVSGRLHQPPRTLFGTDGKSGQTQSDMRGKGGK